MRIVSVALCKGWFATQRTRVSAELADFKLLQSVWITLASIKLGDR